MTSRMEMTKYSPPWLILTLLLCAVVISFIDRQLLGILVDPIRDTIGLTDFEIGILGGAAFFVPYFFGGIAGGWAVDRFNRTGVIALAVAVWSGMTSACGLASTYFHLFLARMGVGFSEGTLGPGVHSVLADTFDKKRLPMAMSFYTAAISLGSGISLAVGGLVLAWAATRVWELPVIGTLHPWQVTFILVGLPGILLAPLIWALVRTPPREQVANYSKDGLLSELVHFGKKRLRLVILYTIAIGTLTGAKFSFQLWIPTLLIRVHHVPALEVGAILGGMFLTVGIAGSLVWGSVATYLAKRGREDASYITILVTAGVFALMVFLPPLMSTSFLVFLFFAPCLFFVQSCFGLGHAAVQLVTPTRLRGRVSAAFNGTVNIIGTIVGPAGIGALSTFFFEDDQKLGLSIALMTGVMSAVGFFCLYFALKPYREAQALLISETEQRALTAESVVPAVN
jgi:MFS family permease